MTTINKTLSLKKVALAAAFAVVMTAAFAVPAKADRDDRGWRDHEVRARSWHRVHPHYVPGVVYAPPPVVYAPPPPPSGISLILPINIR